jgi:hypothetical protein
MVIGVFSQEMGIEGEREEQSRAVSYLLYIPETEAEIRDSCLGGAILHSCIFFIVCLLHIVCMQNWRSLFRPACIGRVDRNGTEA